MLLAIDTATKVMTLALHDGIDLLAEQTWHTENNHSTQLAPAVQKLLACCEVSLSDLAALAVSIGPGSFTGLRIGVALAKGIASANDLPLVGISTLDVLAAGHPYFSTHPGVIAAVQAGRGRIIVRTYRWRKGKWSSQTEPQLMNWETLFSRVDGPAYLTGEIDTAGREALATAQAKDIPVKLTPAAFRLRRAGFLAEEAWERLREEQANFDATRLVPVYVKTGNGL
jgi:tRNA threonylcarbamoyladenosine biosynthesis protein TsaB